MDSGDPADELRTLRERLAAVERLAEQLEAGSQIGSRTLAVRTKTLGSYPTSGAGRVFACSPLDVSGAEAENATASLAAQSQTIYVVNLGTGLPAVGTDVIARWVDHAWVMRYD